MRVLTLGANNASTQNNTIKGLRALGIQAKGLCFESRVSIYNDFSCISLPNLARGSSRRLGLSWWKRKLLSAFLFLRALFWADIIHCYSDFRVFPFRLDCSLIKLLRKKGVIEFQGSDIRIPEVEMSTNPVFRLAFLDPQYEYPLECAEVSLKRQRRFASLGFWPVVSGALPLLDKSLFPRFSIVYHPNLVRDTVPHFPPAEKSRPVIIAHAPSAPVAKGTKYVIRAVENLKKKYDLEFIFIQNMPLPLALKAIEDCDIYVDQMIWGGYAVTSQQAMALGKPIVCYLKPVLSKYLYPADIPVINATVDNLEEKLAELIKDPLRRHELGKRSRQYVEKYHDHIVVAAKLVEIYTCLLSSREVYAAAPLPPRRPSG
jgi:glycosyltransferase involved in cell wall biosynthesis